MEFTQFVGCCWDRCKQESPKFCHGRCSRKPTSSRHRRSHITELTFLKCWSWEYFLNLQCVAWRLATYADRNTLSVEVRDLVWQKGNSELSRKLSSPLWIKNKKEEMRHQILSFGKRWAFSLFKFLSHANHQWVTHLWMQFHRYLKNIHTLEIVIFLVQVYSKHAYICVLQRQKRFADRAFGGHTCWHPLALPPSCLHTHTELQSATRWRLLSLYFTLLSLSLRTALSIVVCEGITLS